MGPTPVAVAGKKIKGSKRQIITDTESHLVGLTVHTADIQDRDGAVSVIASIRRLYPWLRHLFAVGGDAGEKLADALADRGTWTIEIFKRSDTAKGFDLLPRRVVERTPSLAGLLSSPRSASWCAGSRSRAMRSPSFESGSYARMFFRAHSITSMMA